MERSHAGECLTSCVAKSKLWVSVDCGTQPQSDLKHVTTSTGAERRKSGKEKEYKIGTDTLGPYEQCQTKSTAVEGYAEGDKKRRDCQ